MLRLVLVGPMALLLASCADGAVSVTDQQPALELTGRVVDAADILSSEFEARLTATLAALEKDTRVQLVVTTTPDLEGEDIASYSYTLANSWGIGSAERNDGLMVLVAPNERKVRIEVGYGLEASVKDEEAAQIIRNDVVPHFQRGDYETGIEASVQSLILEVTPDELKKAA